MLQLDHLGVEIT